MDSFLYSINATVPIFLVMIVGWVIKQLGVIDDHFANVANKYVFKVALPVLLFRDLAAADFKSQFDVKFVLYCMLVTTIMFSGIWICTEIFMKDDTQKGAFVQASFRSSAAILGMAFIQNMYQSTGMAPLMIVAAVPLFNIFSVIVLTFKAHPDSISALQVHPAFHRCPVPVQDLCRHSWHGNHRHGKVHDCCRPHRIGLSEMPRVLLSLYG